MSPVSINGVDKQGVDKNGVQVKQTLSDANETVNKGVYAATTLSAVDADLAVGNIKSGVTIFGKLGTVAASLAEDILNKAQSTLVAGAATESPLPYLMQAVTAGTDFDLATCTTNFAATSRAVASGATWIRQGYPNSLKVRLYMDGVQVAESEFVVLYALRMLQGTAALSGSKIVKIAVHNYNAADVDFLSNAPGTGQPIIMGVMVGSIKLV